jgi:acylphosphatase
MSEGKQAKRWVVQGCVQGVGFRYFVQHTANTLGLAGWARNLSDGSVEVYAMGPEGRLHDLAAALYQGPAMADVRSVEEQTAEMQDVTRFSIR